MPDQDTGGKEALGYCGVIRWARGSATFVELLELHRHEWRPSRGIQRRHSTEHHPRPLQIIADCRSQVAQQIWYNLADSNERHRA